MTKSGRQYFNGLSIDNGFNSGGLDLGYQHELIVDKPKLKLTCMIPKLSHALSRTHVPCMLGSAWGHIFFIFHITDMSWDSQSSQFQKMELHYYGARILMIRTVHHGSHPLS